MMHSEHDFFDDLAAQHGTWQPPVYPDLSDPAWLMRFRTADELQRRDLATAWVWRFNEEARFISQDAVLEKISDHVKPIRTFHTYRDSTLFKDTVYETAISAFLKTPAGIRDTNRRSDFIHVLNTLWHGQGETRTAAIYKVAKLVTPIAKGGASKQPFCLDIMQRLVWDAVQDIQDPNPQQLANAVKTSILYATKGAPVKRVYLDPRAKAWHLLTTAAIKQHIKSTAQITVGTDSLHVIREMPVLTVVDGLSLLMPYVSTLKGNGARCFDKGSVLAPDTQEAPTAFDVLRHLAPTHSATWDTFEALGLNYSQVHSQLYREFKARHAESVVLPNDLDHGANV